MIPCRWLSFLCRAPSRNPKIRRAGRSAGRCAGRCRRMLTIHYPAAPPRREASPNTGASDDDAAAPHLHRGGSRRSPWDLARECVQPRPYRRDPGLANGSTASGVPRGARGPSWACAAAPRRTVRAALPCSPIRDDGRPPIEGLTAAAPVAMSARAMTEAALSYESLRTTHVRTDPYRGPPPLLCVQRRSPGSVVL